MKHPILLLPVLAGLGACGSQPTVKAENASLAEVAAATRDAVKMEPGKWQTTVNIVSVDAPGMPEQVAAAMKRQIGAMGPQTSESCLSPEQAARPPGDMFSGAAKGCRYEKFEMTGGKVDGTLVCTGAGMPGEMRSTMSGTFATTSFAVTSTAAMAMPGGVGGGRIETKTQVTGKRIGACDGGAR